MIISAQCSKSSLMFEVWIRIVFDLGQSFSWNLIFRNSGFSLLNKAKKCGNGCPLDFHWKDAPRSPSDDSFQPLALVMIWTYLYFVCRLHLFSSLFWKTISLNFKYVDSIWRIYILISDMQFNPQQNAKIEKLHSHVHSALLTTFLYAD